MGAEGAEPSTYLVNIGYERIEAPSLSYECRIAMDRRGVGSPLAILVRRIFVGIPSLIIIPRDRGGSRGVQGPPPLRVGGVGHYPPTLGLRCQREAFGWDRRGQGGGDGGGAPPHLETVRPVGMGGNLPTLVLEKERWGVGPLPPYHPGTAATVST